MRVFLAGATGALGTRLVPLLVADGHQVVGTTRSATKSGSLRAAGAEPVVVDALDRDAIHRAVVAARPDVVVHQMTSLSRMIDLRHFDDQFALTNRLRTEGTANLLSAARAARAGRFVAQSYTGWPNVRAGGRVKTEADGLDPDPPRTARRTLDAIRQLESMVSGVDGMTGIVLRYGSFYGPGTSIAPNGDIVKVIRNRQFPVFGDGAGVWSFLHIDDAAAATRLAIDGDATGLYNVVDDEPAEVAVWLPELARAVGARAPYRLPAWLGRLAIGEAGLSMMTRIRGSSNAKAKRELRWTPACATWRDGFRRGLA